MESVCRDAVLRRNSDKIEEIHSQDEEEEDAEEEEGAVDSDVVVETKGSSTTTKAATTNVLPLSPHQSDPKPIVESVKSAAVPTVEPRVDKETVTEPNSAKVSDSSSAVKVQEATEETAVEPGMAKSEKSMGEKSSVSVESIDCDKPKSGAKVEGASEKKEVVDATDEVMDLDSQDSELGAPTKLPKESERVVVKEKVEEVVQRRKSEAVDQSAPTTLKSSSDAVEPAQNKSSSNGICTESVPSLEESRKSSDKLENLLKRKRSTSTPEKNADCSEQISSNGTEAVTDDLTKAAAAEAEVKEREVEPTVKKAKLSETATELLHRELEANFGRHDKLLREYITKSSAESTEGIQQHVDQLVMEIEALNDMIRTKEMEWNNMIHLKKVKEELVLRLTRKKHVEEIQAAPFDRKVTVAQGSVAAADLFGGSGASSKVAVQANKLIKNLQLSSSLSGAAATSKTTQSILQNRANMTSEDLEKEKKNTAKLHR